MAGDRVYPLLRIIWLPENLSREAACNAQECGRVSDSPQDVDGKAKCIFSIGLLRHVVTIYRHATGVPWIVCF